MNDIEKDLFRKTVAIKTTSIKPVEYSVLSEDKSIRADETFPHSAGSLSRIEKILRHHRKAVSLIQWLVVLLYFSLLLLPALSGNFIDERVYDSISDFSRLIFWGTGWPLIVLSMMVCGRIWCGLFCPDGTLTEFISRHGQKRSIPRWIRWKGWPCTVLTGTVLYGQLIAVYDNFPATLVLLGIPTCLALLTGFLYGNGKRIWCMYLCPGNGIFGLLARLSPIYYKVDREKWEQYSGQQERLDCPTLINVRQMQGMSGCHACGRCLGHRNAVELGFRSPSSEIVTTPENRISGSELFLLLWGVTGICTAALAWRGNVLYSQFILRLAQLDVLAASDLPWWLSASPSSPFLLIFIIISGSALALMIYVLLRLAALVSGNGILWKQLALCLIPVTGFGIFLGISQIGFSLWEAYGFHSGYIPVLQFMVLTAASLFSVWLGIRIIFGRIHLANMIAFFIYCLSVALLFAVWTNCFLT